MAKGAARRDWWKVRILFGLMTFLWGLGFVMVRLGSKAAVPPFLGSGIRFMLAATLGGAICLFRRVRPRFTGRDIERYVVVAVTAYVVPFGLIYCGMRVVTAPLTAVLSATTPLFATLLARWFLHEALTIRKVVGVVGGLVGVAAIYADRLQGGESEALGVILVLLAGLGHALASVYVRGRCRGSDPLTLNAVAMAVGGSILLAISAAVERPWPSLAPVGLFTIVWLAVFSSVVCYGIFWWLLGRIEVSRASLTSFLIPLVTLLLGWLFLRERLTAGALFGGVLVLAGVVISVTEKPVRPVAPAPAAN